MATNGSKFQDGESYHDLEEDIAAGGSGNFLEELIADIADLDGVLKKANLTRKEFEGVIGAFMKEGSAPIDDRNGVTEAMVGIMASLPSTSKRRVHLTNKFIDNLWDSLQHPPLSYVGGDVSYDVVKELQKPQELADAVKGLKPEEKVVFKFPESETVVFKVPEADKIDFIVPGTNVRLSEQVPKAPNGLFQYRMPDGSFNSVLDPNLGRAGTPYAKSVRPDKRLQGVRPDPGLLFDTLMARDKEKFKVNPAGISSMLFYHASIIIHDIFRTNRKDQNISDTSSYLDLAPLYGSSLKDQLSIRTMSEGKLKPDTFCERRLVGQPAGVNVMLVLYSRFHNHVAENLLKINEGNRFSLQIDRNARTDEEKEIARAKALAKQDHDLFNTARLVVGGMYINVSLHDYLRAITNTHSTDTDWTLDPRVDISKQFDGEGVPRGIGNQVSVEFNLLYRFHSCISQKDEKWTEDFFANEIFEGKKTADQLPDVEMRDLWPALLRFEDNLKAQDPSERVFGGLKRGADGKFKDEDLARILSEATQDPAGAFGARTIPKSMRIIEIMGILQGRKWQVASLNEFRKFFGLKRYEKFEEINSDKNITDMLKKLYADVDMVEMYPGLMVEDAKPKRDPGSGICPTYSLGKAILSDAITLVRSDRFNTIDYNVANLTSWGFNEAQYDAKTLGGSMLYKLIHRGLPGWFPFNSVSIMQPMYTKKRNIEIATKLGTISQFEQNDAIRAPPATDLISKEADIKTALSDVKSFKAPWVDNLNLLFPGKKNYDWFFLAGNEKQHQDHRKIITSATAKIPDLHKIIHEFVEVEGRKLIAEERFTYKTYKGPIDELDLIRDVAIPLNARLLAELLYLDMKTDKYQGGTLEPSDVYRHLLNIHNWGFNNDDPAEAWNRRRRAQESVNAISSSSRKLVDEATGGTGWLGLGGWLGGKKQVEKDSLRSCGLKLVQELSAQKVDNEKIIENLWLTAFGNVAAPVTTFYEVMQFFLRPENKAIWAEVQALAVKDDDEAIHPYVEEAQRLSTTRRMTRVVKEKVTLDGKAYEKGTVLTLDVGKAGRADVANPDKFDINRTEIDAKDAGPKKAVSTSLLCQHEVLGNHLASTFVAGLVRLIAELKDLHPAVNESLPPADQGVAKRITSGNRTLYLNDSWSYLGHDVSTWKVQFNGYTTPDRYPKST